MGQVVDFPVQKRRADIEYENEKAFYELDELLNSISIITDELVESLIADMFELEYTVDDEKYVYDISMIYETIRSLICKLHDQTHPMQSFAAKIYEDEMKEREYESKQYSFDFVFTNNEN